MNKRKDRFNRYCAEVMDLKNKGWTTLALLDYNPFDDLNQMAEVFDKLYGKERGSMHKVGCFMYNVLTGIKQAMQDFIESTMETDK